MIHNKCPHPYHKTKQRKLVESSVVLVVILGFGLFFLLGQSSIQSIDAYKAENELLQRSVDDLTKANKELLKQRDFIESDKKIDAQAQKDFRQSLTSLQDKLSAAKEQLAFYQRVVAPETLVKGLYINSFQLKRIGDEQHYEYELIVAQGASQKRAIKGKYTLRVTGTQGGKEKSFSFAELSSSATKSKGFSFRYYEILKGKVILPQGFLPKQVVVKASPSTKKAKSVEQQWLWTDVISSN
jgi:cell division protein FtsB